MVTDSTSTLDLESAHDAGIIIVPITVAIDDDEWDETDDPEAVRVNDALIAHRRVTTSRPTPERFRDAFAAAAAAGATSIVCVTLSRRLSATWESAELAARDAPVPVTVVDSESVAMGVGFAALRGAQAAATEADVDAVAQVVRHVAEASSVVFCVDSLEHLRRGGRIGSAAAVLGQALQVKPLLTLVDGEVAVLERVRTTSRALDRLCAVAVERADGRAVDIAVQHLGSAQRAEEIAHRLRTTLPEAEVIVRPVGASLGIHGGPGLVAVVISPR